MATTFPIKCVAIFGVSALVAWLLLMLGLRRANFANGGRKKMKRPSYMIPSSSVSKLNITIRRHTGL
jgi:hypothetical protein